MNIDELTKMVNEIAAFFVGEFGPEKAVAEVSSHIRRYWDPRMRREIMAHQARGGGGLSEVSGKAVAALASAAR